MKKLAEYIQYELLKVKFLFENYEKNYSMFIMCFMFVWISWL